MSAPTSNLNQKRVFLTGATGLVGGFVAEELVRRGATVVALVRDTLRNTYFETSKIQDRCILVRGELEDFSLLQRIMNEYQIEGVIHLAAQTQVRVANEHPIPTFMSNIQGTWNVLEAARQCRSHLKFAIIASSDKAYGEPLTESYSEDHPLNAQYPYDVSKACADMIAKTYANTYQLPVAVTRCGNFFGPGDLNVDRIIPHVILSYIAGKSPVLRSNGNLVRDYFYVKDGANAYVFLSEKMLEPTSNLTGEVFNFSYGVPHSVLDVVKLIAKQMRCENLPPQILDNAAHEIKHQCLSAAHARQTLGWRPLFSFEKGLEETIRWYREISSK